MKITKEYLRKIITEEINNVVTTMTGQQLIKVMQTAKSKGDGDAAGELEKFSSRINPGETYTAKNNHEMQIVNIIPSQSLKNITTHHSNKAGGEKFSSVINSSSIGSLSYGASNVLKDYGLIVV